MEVHEREQSGEKTKQETNPRFKSDFLCSWKRKQISGAGKSKEEQVNKNDKK